MKLYRLFLPLILVLGSVCCSKEGNLDIEKEQKKPIEPQQPESEDPQEPSTINYLTYIPTFNTDDKDHWIIIHNQDGELLDYSSFESGDKLVFKALESELSTTDRLSVTIMDYHLRTATKHHVFRTYTGIEKGTVWDITESSDKISLAAENSQNFLDINKVDKGSFKKVTTTYNLNVNNIPNIAKYTLSSVENGTIAENHQFQFSSTLDINQIELSSDIEYLLSIGDGDGGLKYYLVDPPENPEDIVLDYDDFLEYDKVITVPLPENQNRLLAWVFARNSSNFSEKPLVLTKDTNAGPIKTIAKFGYLENYPHFDTFFTVKMTDGYGYGYQEIGEIPNTIAIMPRPNFEILDSSIESFDFSTDIDYAWRTSLWGLWEIISVDENQNQTHWYVNATNNGEKNKIGSLPSEIMEKYPDLNLEDLYHINTTFSLKGRSYEDILDTAFRGVTTLYPVYEWLDFFNPQD